MKISDKLGSARPLIGDQCTDTENLSEKQTIGFGEFNASDIPPYIALYCSNQSLLFQHLKQLLDLILKSSFRGCGLCSKIGACCSLVNMTREPLVFPLLEREYVKYPSNVSASSNVKSRGLVFNLLISFSF